MDRELSSAVEFVKDKLYYVTLRVAPRPTQSATFVCVDDHLVYEPFFADFGPLNLGQLYRFCQIINARLADPANAQKRVYFYSGHDQHKRANAAYLIGAYAVLYLHRTPEEAYRPFLGIYPPFFPFRDASFGLSTFNLTVLDCLRGLWKAVQCGFLNVDTFNVEEYEHFERVENGDLNWIIPGKLVAFSGPTNNVDDRNGIRTFTPEDYVPLFKKWGVNAIIRLNKKCYDRRKFVDFGINHHDLYFVDGGTPSEAILRRFLEICEAEPGAVGVHCKAGLGRTGTLIGCYIMKHYQFTATEVIAWLRICRPGSVIGPQQHFLQDQQPRLWKQGEVYRKRLQGGATPGAAASAASAGSSSFGSSSYHEQVAMLAAQVRGVSTHDSGSPSASAAASTSAATSALVTSPMRRGAGSGQSVVAAPPPGPSALATSAIRSPGAGVGLGAARSSAGASVASSAPSATASASGIYRQQSPGSLLAGANGGYAIRSALSMSYAAEHARRGPSASAVGASAGTSSSTLAATRAAGAGSVLGATAAPSSASALSGTRVSRLGRPAPTAAAGRSSVY